MSRLRELRVHGFKTFADPTRFTFERGITAVIGPNGSGKSNMADAIRWVLGEQSNRSLRMRRAEDVIFAGSQQRRAQGMAEAIVTLDNADRWLPIDFAEVSIGRRVYRSGESEYLLNGARVRLRDITELLGEGRLGATDLVVVGQGTVDSALSLRPEERRQLFEEAAGVKALQVRKNEALARLAGARDNLVRVRDLVAELRPQVRRLALQAEHQERHDELATALAALTEESHRRRETQARELVAEAARRAAAAETELAGFKAAHGALDEAIREAQAAQAEAEAAASGAGLERERARDAAIRAEAELDSLRVRQQELAEAIAATQEAERVATARIAAVRAAAGEGTALGASQGSAAGDPPDVDAAEARWRAAADEVRAADDALLALEDRLAHARREHAMAEAERLASEAALDRARDRHGRLEVERASVAAAVPQLHDALATAERVASDAAEVLAEARLQEQSASEAAEQAAQGVAARRGTLAQLRAQIEVLRGAQPGDATTSADDALGPPLLDRLRSAGWEAIDKVLRVDGDQRRAVEAAIGEALETALVWDGEGSPPELSNTTGAVRMLVVDRPGGAPATEPEGREVALRAVRGTQTLAEWLNGSSGSAVFRSTVVAPDHAALLNGWRGLPAGWSAITREGDFADHRGVVVLRGRSDARATTTPSARNAQILARLIEDERAQQEALACAERTGEEAVRALRDARDARRVAERRAHELAATVDAARQRHDRAVRALADLDAELAAAARAVAEVGPRQTTPAAGSAADSTDARQLTTLEAEARALALQHTAAVRRRDEARAAWDTAREAAERASRSQRAVAEELGRAEAERVAAAAALPIHTERLAALGEQIAAAVERLATLRRVAAAADERRNATARAHEEARAGLADAERRSAGASARRAQLEAVAERARLDLARDEEALAALRRDRDLELDGLPAASEPSEMRPAARAYAGLSDVDLEAELRRVRRTLSQIGSVNPFAVAEHRELSGRLGELTAQEADLEGALSSTGTLVRQLETEIAERFGAAFEAIGAAFDEFARILFAGGSASVRMTGEDDGSSPAIEIAVRPPGKRLQPLSSLSGGERALAGVALLFAMLTVHPVPFCVLDEVDAALDEANVGRFAEALRRLSATTDFVVVTHNRATIEMADTIYGVTMTDAAVSRVLSLRLSDVPLEATG